MKFFSNNRSPEKTGRARRQTFIITAALVALLLQAGFSASAQTAARANKAEQILEAETLLSNLGYWITKIDGAADASNRHALVAFQKVEGRGRTGILTAKELEALRAASRPAAKFSNLGAAHIEIDITRQVLFLVDENGIAARVLHVSTGNEQKYFDQGKWQIAHTPRGSFRVTRQIYGVRRAPLGNLYFPNYFTGGVAIHGSLSVPAYSASHGCVRIPYFAAEAFQKLVSVGTPVFVYD